MRQRYGDNTVIQRAAGLNVKHNDFNPFNGLRS
jgi:hypothetical protein